MNIEKFCEKYNLGKVKSVHKLSGGLMHKMFKTETNQGIYAIKILNKEVMNRKEAYNNFIISEKIANLVKKEIPVSSAIKIEENYLTKFEEDYYMVFDFIEGKTLKDEEIKIEHCKQIGKILAKLHSIDYKKIGLHKNIVEYKRLVNWKSFTKNSNFPNMSYKKQYLTNYQKYNSILNRANKRFNKTNVNQTICHKDMDPKNVMWYKNAPTIIDWESAGIANPERELLEDALCWSGFLSNNFSEEKFTTIFKEYAKYRSIENVDWFNVIGGNLVGRFGWLKYNLERSLGIISEDKEEMKLAEKEVTKTIEEINRYLELIGTMYDLINNLSKTKLEIQDEVINKIIKENELLKKENPKLLNVGFTNTIYKSENYIIKICTNINNEKQFKNEIDFYHKNKDIKNIPMLYISDTTKQVVPYYYEILEKKEGQTLYEVWYKLGEEKRKEILIKLIKILKEIHRIKIENNNFNELIKEEISTLTKECNIKNNNINTLLESCNIYFKENKFTQIHGDLHFDNILYKEGELVILDFETWKIAPLDYEFRILNRYQEKPWKWASIKTDMLTVEKDYQSIMDILTKNYDELKNISYLNERLKIYEIIEILKDYQKTKSKKLLEEIEEKIEILLKEEK